jgi:iron complex transport system substrate-binding protein
VAFLEWLDPLFNGGHWNPHLVELAGGVNVLGRAGEPSRTTSWEAFLATEPEVIFIACCGFDRERARQDLPAVAARPGWRDLPAARNGRVYIADGNAYFSRPGPRLVESLELLAHALHPHVHPPGPPFDTPNKAALRGG